ncbi:MAG: glycosyltransferase [Akkermansiaceae bacterium]|jgi:GT2 family glycosyltransferase|nr:glycosyltransferase [Akkermansiaceae bacterium]
MDGGSPAHPDRLRVEGRFLCRGKERAFLRMVTYGPFPPARGVGFADDFARIRAAGFDAIRLYSWPSPALLDAAASAGLGVWAGLSWPPAVDFRDGVAIGMARASLTGGLAASAGHPALDGVFVGNEIPADLVRWMGVDFTREKIEELIDLGRDLAPELLWAYANYPSTEYLEPGNASLTAMNVYLEDADDLGRYLARLHHIAGDRPLLISEFGLDSRRHGPARQAEILAAAVRTTREAGAAGFTAYSWSDSWWNAGAEVLDWDFGLTDRDGREKPALAALSTAFVESRPPTPPLRFSVIVCTRNGAGRIATCLQALRELRETSYEVIVVDDGSTDDTAALVESGFPEVRLIRLEPCGLSAARNAGAAAAAAPYLAFTDDDCEPDPHWLAELARVFAMGWDAVGGPNLAPAPQDWQAAVVAAAPGAASHVMIDDLEAEHVPGCNLAVTAEAFHAIGGFDRRFRTAGDDVDFCWRLRDARRRIGFAPNAWVWHHRRPTLRGYLRQQRGYGVAEALLMKKHPRRFTPGGDARWSGVIYTGAPVRAMGEAVIYHGLMGTAGYQRVIARMQPLRDLDSRFDHAWARLALGLLSWWAPLLRCRARTGRFRGPVKEIPRLDPAPTVEIDLSTLLSREEILRALLADGWQAADSDAPWDLEKSGTRVLVACERFDLGRKRALFRVWGNPAKIRASLTRLSPDCRP